MSWPIWIVLLVLLLGLVAWTLFRAPGREQDPGLQKEPDKPPR